MAQSYRQITPELARQIRLVMTDVDGTLTSAEGSLSSEVVEAVGCLEQRGITVGLVSGRTLPELESLAHNLGIKGPIIAENGGVARPGVADKVLDLGYSRQPAIQALEKLKILVPGAIKEREDNKDRLVDIVFWCRGLETRELTEHLEDTQLLDSGYILHIMQRGISKGQTLMKLQQQAGGHGLSPAEIMVFGDSTTDMSLFELFPHSVCILNPRLPVEHRQALQETARYASRLPFGEGFAEVAFHIVAARTR